MKTDLTFDTGIFLDPNSTGSYNTIDNSHYFGTYTTCKKEHLDKINQYDKKTRKMLLKLYLKYLGHNANELYYVILKQTLKTYEIIT